MASGYGQCLGDRRLAGRGPALALLRRAVVGEDHREPGPPRPCRPCRSGSTPTAAGACAPTRIAAATRHSARKDIISRVPHLTRVQLIVLAALGVGDQHGSGLTPHVPRPPPGPGPSSHRRAGTGRSGPALSPARGRRRAAARVPGQDAHTRPPPARAPSAAAAITPVPPPQITTRPARRAARPPAWRPAPPPACSRRARRPRPGRVGGVS